MLNTDTLLIIVLSLINISCLVRLNHLRKEKIKTHKKVRQLSRTIEKLDSENGQLWYKISKNQGMHGTDADESSFTVTSL